ncbi:MAG: hypothetical protein HOV80_26770 [Polyangiaceae bacterium]|nr:hypothetical protein [Polyangiaceae bacterium]
MLALLAVGGVLLILWLDKPSPEAPPPAAPVSGGVVFEPKEGAVVAVADHDGRVFFLHATFANDPSCEPKCYESELRELGVRGGTKLGNAGGEPTTLAASNTHATWGRSGLWDLQPLAGGERKPLSTGGERAALDATHAYFAGRELSRIALDTGKSELLVGSASAVDVGIDNLSVYYLEPGARTLWRMLKQGGARTPIAKELDGIVRLSVGKGRVYVAARGKPPSTQGTIWDIAADGTDRKELAKFEGDPVALDSASGKVDWIVYKPGSQAVLYTAAAGSPARELRKFDAPVLKGSGDSKRELAPDVASTERFVYVTSAGGLLQIERR